MSVFTAIFDALQADTTLMSILTGGLYSGLAVSDISRQLTPAAYDEFGELRPCGLLKGESATPWGPHDDTGRLYVVLWLSAQRDIAALDAARERTYKVLHRAQVSTSVGLFDVRHANDVMGTEVAALDVPTIASRYYATVDRS
jgi:hypothetical protein